MTPDGERLAGRGGGRGNRRGGPRRKRWQRWCSWEAESFAGGGVGDVGRGGLLRALEGADVSAITAQRSSARVLSRRAACSCSATVRDRVEDLALGPSGAGDRNGSCVGDRAHAVLNGDAVAETGEAVAGRAVDRVAVTPARENLASTVNAAGSRDPGAGTILRRAGIRCGSSVRRQIVRGRHAAHPTRYSAKDAPAPGSAASPLH